MRAALRHLALSLSLLLLPAEVFAQLGSLTGTVRDSSGAVLPGVTVRASSDTLIEKVRTATTDGSGQYRIIDLRAGIYRLTFRLAGFQTTVQESIELTGSATLSIHAEMRVGSVRKPSRSKPCLPSSTSSPRGTSSSSRATPSARCRSHAATARC